ncbi:uncharacterized protein LOC135370209 [Ornithodoros turicata]|uniref:uncharacterized protein LOC135370209 n=1 Tax=Ornithodoros turicata TaxID=34597 RepID=UPI00313A1243
MDTEQSDTQENYSTEGRRHSLRSWVAHGTKQVKDCKSLSHLGILMPLCLSPILYNGSVRSRCLYCILLSLSVWTLSSLPVPVGAFLHVVDLPLCGVMSPEQFVQEYLTVEGIEVILLTMLVISLESRTSLISRFAYGLGKKYGLRHGRFFFTICAATFISAMLCPQTVLAVPLLFVMDRIMCVIFRDNMDRAAPCDASSIMMYRETSAISLSTRRLAFTRDDSPLLHRMAELMKEIGSPTYEDYVKDRISTRAYDDADIESVSTAMAAADETMPTSSIRRAFRQRTSRDYVDSWRIIDTPGTQSPEKNQADEGLTGKDPGTHRDLTSDGTAIATTSNAIEPLPCVAEEADMGYVLQAFAEEINELSRQYIAASATEVGTRQALRQTEQEDNVVSAARHKSVHKVLQIRLPGDDLKPLDSWATLDTTTLASTENSQAEKAWSSVSMGSSTSIDQNGTLEKINQVMQELSRSICTKLARGRPSKSSIIKLPKRKYGDDVDGHVDMSDIKSDPPGTVRKTLQIRLPDEDEEPHHEPPRAVELSEATFLSDGTICHVPGSGTSVGPVTSILKQNLSAKGSMVDIEAEEKNVPRGGRMVPERRVCVPSEEHTHTSPWRQYELSEYPRRISMRHPTRSHDSVQRGRYSTVSTRSETRVPDARISVSRQRTDLHNAFILGPSLMAVLGNISSALSIPAQEAFNKMHVEAHREQLTCGHWFILTLPGSLLAFTFVYIYLYYDHLSRYEAGVNSDEHLAVTDHAQHKLKYLGPLSATDHLYGCYVLLFCVSYYSFVYVGHDTMNAQLYILSGMVLLDISVRQAFDRKPLSLRSISFQMPWGVLFILGAVRIISSTIETFDMIGELFRTFDIGFWSSYSALEVQAVLAVVSAVLAETTNSNTLCQIMMPIINDIAASTSLNPMYYAIPVVVGASTNIVMPISVPLAILHEVADVTMWKLVLIAVVVKAVLVGMIVLTVNTAGSAFFSWGTPYLPHQ